VFEMSLKKIVGVTLRDKTAGGMWTLYLKALDTKRNE